MDYENKYKELLARLQKAKENEEVNDERYCCVIDDIVPELKEDEDELTWLKNYISEEAYYLSMDIRDNKDSIKLQKLQKSLAWLKKQGEQKSNPYSGTSFEYNGHTWGMCARDGGVDILYDSRLINHIDDPQDKTVTEDEKIRKALIEYYSFDEDGHSHALDNITPEQIVDWLEKQGESVEINPTEFDTRLQGTYQTPDEIIEECHQDNADHIIDIVTEHGKPSEWNEVDENEYNHILKLLNLVAEEQETKGYNNLISSVNWLKSIKDRIQSKQSSKPQGKSATEAIKEEKVDNANKVESKFKVGDWVVRKDGKNFHDSKTIQFTKTDENACQFGSIRRLYEDKIRHWTIADAQDGDVLVASDGSIFIFAGVVDCACKYYVSLTATNDVKINKEKKGGYWETSRAVYPATKEQRDLLFQKMKDDGCKWDSESKELIKIE